jgi:hypothetical protein
VCRHLFPAGLVQVLADVLRFWVVSAVPFNGHRPVICRPENLDACGARAGAPSAETGEQADCCGHVVVLAFRRRPRRGGVMI